MQLQCKPYTVRYDGHEHKNNRTDIKKQPKCTQETSVLQFQSVEAVRCKCKFLKLISYYQTSLRKHYLHNPVKAIN